jgi:hypothetical protein
MQRQDQKYVSTPSDIYYSLLIRMYLTLKYDIYISEEYYKLEEVLRNIEDIMHGSS